MCEKNKGKTKKLSQYLKSCILEMLETILLKLVCGLLKVEGISITKLSCFVKESQSLPVKLWCLFFGYHTYRVGSKTQAYKPPIK